MKKIILFIIALGLFGACEISNTAAKKPVENSDRASVKKEDVAVHTFETQSNIQSATTEKSNTSQTKSKWTRSGDPIDTSELDNAIAKAAGNSDLAKAYFERGLALTKARQYASAIGDYRRVLKYESDHKDAKNWIEQISAIYASMNREIPKPGEEPKPLKLNE